MLHLTGACQVMTCVCAAQQPFLNSTANMPHITKHQSVHTSQHKLR